MLSFPNVYLHLFNGDYISFPNWFTENILANCFLLDIPKLSPSIIIDQDKKDDYCDGTSGVASEKLNLELASFRCDPAYLAALRLFHNANTDVILMDPASPPNTILISNIRISVLVIAENKETAIIKITATRFFSPEQPLDYVICMGSDMGIGIISGTVYDVNGTTPLPGVTVSTNFGTHNDITDSFGRYNLALDGGTLPSPITYTLLLTKTGKTFPTGQTVQLVKQNEVKRNFSALT
ncbi:MAG: hypothetical protein Q8M98_05200 [Candidatus Cloacimonadaceae bacterium]|nr:hypothetical protein [Candidatus Cloacimonadaceae bacterium]